jgi:hypothetical protein
MPALVEVAPADGPGDAGVRQAASPGNYAICAALVPSPVAVTRALTCKIRTILYSQDLRLNLSRELGRLDVTPATRRNRVPVAMTCLWGTTVPVLPGRARAGAFGVRRSRREVGSTARSL